MADLSTLDPQQFEAWLNQAGSVPFIGSTVNVTGQAAFGAGPVLAQSANALKNVITQTSRINAGLEDAIGPQVNLQRGAPASVRARMSFDQDTLNQYKLLTKVYGDKNVDIVKDRFLIKGQTNPETGEKEDFFADPIGFDPGDAAGFSADVIPTLVSIIGARFGGRSAQPLKKLAGGLAGAAVGFEGASAVQTELSRAFQGVDLKPGTLAYERAKSALLDMTIGLGMASGAKIATKLSEAALGTMGVEIGSKLRIAPDAKGRQIPITGPASQTVQRARDLEVRTGVKYPLTPGEAADNPMLMRVEETAKPRMGFTGAMGESEAAKAKAEGELRRVFLGLPRETTDEELAGLLPRADETGQRVLGRLGGEALSLEGNIARAKEVVERTGTREAQAVAKVNLETPLEPTAVGQALRNKAVVDFETFKTTMAERYEEFLSRPEIRSRTVSGNSLATSVKRMENEMVPAAQRGVVKEQLDAFIPAKFRSFADELKNLKGARVSVNDLKQIRTAIDSAIAEGVAIPGTDVAQLRGLRETVNSNITNALKDMDKLPAAYRDTAPLTYWENLNRDYASGMSRFDRKGIREMLIPEGETGSIGNARLARNVASGSEDALDRYNDFRQFYGASSPEFNAVQQLAREQVLKGGLAEESGYISGTRLRASLRNLDNEVATDLFGVSKQELHRIGEALSVAQGNLDLADLQRLARSKSLTAAAIPDLIAAERARATAWGNKLIKAAAKGSAIDTEVIKPSEVVRNIVNMDPADAQQILGILSDRPDLIHDVRQLAVEDLWSRVQGQLKGREGATAPLIKQALGTETQQRTWMSLLGSDVVENLKLLSDVVKVQEIPKRQFSQAGSFGATRDITRIEKGQIVEGAFEIASRVILGALYMGPFKKAMTNLATTHDQGRLLNALVASSPFIEHVREHYAPDMQIAIMEAARGIVEPLQEKELHIKGAIKSNNVDPSKFSAKEFADWLENKAP